MSQDFAPIKRKRLSDQVSAQIQVRIASGELRSGDKLPPERELAESFGVSRGAVREALRNLERTGLIALQAGAHGGAFIGQGDPGLIGDSFRNLYQLGSVSLDELTEARLWLASTVVRIACARATDADLAALTANVDEAERLLKARRYDDKIDIHIEFHNLLARATRQRRHGDADGRADGSHARFRPRRRRRAQRSHHQGAPATARRAPQARRRCRRDGDDRASREPARPLSRPHGAAPHEEGDELMVVFRTARILRAHDQERARGSRSRRGLTP